MSLISRMRKQTAVYWALASPISVDDYGQPILTDPVEIECRWDAVNEEFIGPDGTREMSHAKVYPDTDIDVGGVLMLGDEDDATEDNVKENEGAWEVKRFDKIPNIKAIEFLRIAYL